jgi:hypothetical protein
VQRGKSWLKPALSARKSNGILSRKEMALMLSLVSFATFGSVSAKKRSGDKQCLAWLQFGLVVGFMYAVFAICLVLQQY